MALTTCPDCGRQVSTEAAACPGCGRPIAGGHTAPRTLFPAPLEPSPTPAKSRGTYIILGVFFGLLGIHNFYAGYYARGAAQLAITLTLGWLIIGLFISGVWVLFELIGTTLDPSGRPMT